MTKKRKLPIRKPNVDMVSPLGKPEKNKKPSKISKWLIRKLGERLR